MWKRFLIVLILFSVLTFPIVAQKKLVTNLITVTDPEKVFKNPPESAKPGVLWMWMGSNLNKKGITKDLEALKKTGFNRTTMFSVADVTTPWAGKIDKSPTPNIISWTEPWWELVKFAAQESKRLGMDFGMFNCPGYTASGGKWIGVENSMKELVWSEKIISNNQVRIKLDKPSVDLRGKLLFPIYNLETDLVEKPKIPERETYYKDIAVIAVPTSGILSKKDIINLTDKMNPDGTLNWVPSSKKWTIYRFGYTTMGALIQPAQWEATGFEVDKISQKSIEFHMDHVIGEIKKHLGDLVGTGFTHVHFDSYEAGEPTWTPKMQEEFLNRRGYTLTPYLVALTGRIINSEEESKKFKSDFDATIKDLYRDVYFTTISNKLKKAKLEFLCEPYGGPWRQDDIMPLIPNVMTEFWTNKGKYTPYELDPTVEALRKSGQNIIEAEAFTGHPGDSKWTETPNWLKPIGDAAFCAGVNRLILHRFTHQPWDNRFLPGATMGQWGTHFDRTQTWWNDFGSMVQYWQRCQALLQWGSIVTNVQNDFSATNSEGKLDLKSIHRKSENTDIYFVANTSHDKGIVNCSFKISEKQPELWNPVTGEMQNLDEFTEANGQITVPLVFDDAQSFFIVFRNKTEGKSIITKINFPSVKQIFTINRPWSVTFDPMFGGPKKPVVFSVLEDWIKRPESGIKYYSGTAVYTTSFDSPKAPFSDKKSNVYLDLGIVKDVAHVIVNDVDLGTIWTAPWKIKLPAGLLKKKNNKLVIKITNVWANRLIGDEQEPEDCEWKTGHQGGRFLKEFPEWFLKNQDRPSKGRYCFTTWNYFTKESPLISSGLLGPVRIVHY